MAIDKGASFGSASPCSGLGSSVASVDFSANPAPKILFGGVINISAQKNDSSGFYKITGVGKSSISVRVVYR